MSEPARVLIVCTGNICRSPFIERLLQHQLDTRRPGTQGQVLVGSAGTSGLTGWAMDDRAAAQLVAHGGDPEGFRARDLTAELVAESDLVLTATRVHRGKVATLDPKALRKVFTFVDFSDLVTGLAGLSAPLISADPAERVRQVTERAAASRGLRPPLDPGQADIVDPYGCPDEVFATMASQVTESLPAVVRALGG